MLGGVLGLWKIVQPSSSCLALDALPGSTGFGCSCSTCGILEVEIKNVHFVRLDSFYWHSETSIHWSFRGWVILSQNEPMKKSALAECKSAFRFHSFLGRGINYSGQAVP